MKAIIFSCSIKNGKNSSTQAWSELMALRMKNQSIDAEIINLKNIDYEASTGPDLLHNKMAKCFDADFIVIATPINFKHTTFFARNLAKRFKHAHTRAKADGIDLFEKKLFEVCIMHGCKNDHLADGTEIFVEYGGEPTKKFKSLLPDVKYILPQRNLNLRVWQPADKHGPDRKKLHLDTETVRDIDNTIQAFKKEYRKSTPKMSIEKWMQYFSSNNLNAFGRGYTLGITAINEQTVKKHIEWVHQNITDVHKKAQIFVAMKERCIRADFYDEAELYFAEQFEIGESGKTHPGDAYDTSYDDPNNRVVIKWKKDGFRITRSANYRPNNY